MRKVPRIGGWYVGFMAVLCALVWMNSQERVVEAIPVVEIARIPEPVNLLGPLQIFLPPPELNNQPIDGCTYLIGDCTAARDPSDSPRYWVSRATIADLIGRVDNIPCTNPDTLEATFVIMTGGRDLFFEKNSPETIEEELAALRTALQSRFPRVTIFTVSPYEIKALADPKGKGGRWHLKKSQYVKLWANHPEIPH